MKKYVFFSLWWFFPFFNLSTVLRIQVNYIVWIYYSPLTEWMFGLFFQAYMQLSLLIFVGDHNWPNSSLFILYSKIASKQMIFSYWTAPADSKGNLFPFFIVKISNKKDTWQNCANTLKKQTYAYARCNYLVCCIFSDKNCITEVKVLLFYL